MLTKTARPKIGSQGDTKVMYIGSDRFKSLSDAAIKVSFQGGKQITASQMAQYVLAVTGAECNTVIELKLEHHAA